jgi:hypothetical protein
MPSSAACGQAQRLGQAASTVMDSAPFSEIDCERGRSRVVWEGPEPLTFNDHPGNLSKGGVYWQPSSASSLTSQLRNEPTG